MSKKRFISFKVFEGLYVYLDEKNSPFYYVRIRIPDLNKHIVRSSKTSSLVEAKLIAKELWKSLSSNYKTTKTGTQLTIRTWCDKFMRELEKTKPDKNLTTEWNRLLSEETGLCKWFGNVDITEFSNTHVLKYFEYREKDNLTNPTKNKYISLFRSLLNYCFRSGIIPTIPEIPTLRVPNKDNPRPSFNFQGKNNEYDKLLTFVREKVKSQDLIFKFTHVVNEELHKVIMFIVHGFVRPVRSEIMNLKWNDIKLINEKGVKTVQIRVKDGKTGFRYTTSTQYLFDYLDWKVISKNDKPDDYVIYKDYENRTTALRMIQDQFKCVLEELKMTKDEYGQSRSLYSLRHLGIQMRLINSKGKINIYFLAKNCGTSVEMIERFYAKYLPNSLEVIKNLQSFE